MRSCYGCGNRGWDFCPDCDLTYRMAKLELRQITSFLGEGEDEGKMALSAYEIEEFDRLIGQTAIGRASVMRRAEELLLEVEDAFAKSPWCPICREHKLVLELGEPLEAGCTGGCRIEEEH